MKKLMIAAAVAAMTVGAFADACDEVEEIAQCRAWNLKMSLKSLGPKKGKCKVEATSACDDPETSVVYYLDNVTRKAKGYLWICEYECGKAYNAILWDEKNKKVLVPYTEDAVDFDEVYAYGKKGTKVAGTFTLAGADLDGNDAIEVTASGVNGKLVRGKEDTDCYLKSLSGYAAGKIAYVKPASRTVGGTKGSLCVEPEEVEVCDEYAAKLMALCDACCFDGWCEADDADDMVPAVGTWSMKYSKKISKGKKSMAQLAPAWAL